MSVVTEHATERSVERQGNKLCETDAQKIIDDIQNNKAVYLCKGQTSRVVFFAVELDGKAVPVLYSKSTKKIVTIYHRSRFPKLLYKRIIELKGKDARN